MKKHILRRSAATVLSVSLILIALSGTISAQCVDVVRPAPGHHIKRDVPADWLFAVYVAGDNNLHYWLWNNVKQMARVGSNDRVSIVVQVDEPGANRKTQRFLIEKNYAVLLNPESVDAGIKLDSGDPQTLIDFLVDAITDFPARNICVVLSDHGSGIIDPVVSKTINVYDLFRLNPSDLMLELDRSISYLDLIEPIFDRGICFNDTFHTYLNNQHLQRALTTVSQQTGRKINVLGMDACFMQMVEVGSIIRSLGAHGYCPDYVIGSQEVELGAGWDYEQVLKPFEAGSFTPHGLAEHIVQCYDRTYIKVTKDYTLSALNVGLIEQLERNIDAVARQLIALLDISSVYPQLKRALLSARSSYAITSFVEPSYVDLGHLYTNILEQLTRLSGLSEQAQQIQSLKRTLESGLLLIKSVVIANATGKNLAKAQGVSIYFPERRIHQSYYKTGFAAQTNWLRFLERYVSDVNRM